MKAFNYVLFHLRKLYLLYIKNDFHTKNVEAWYRDNKKADLRHTYDLNDNSIVIDAGGYKGDWAETISKKYNAKIFIYEPVPQFYEIIKNRLGKYKNITIMNCGLSHSNSKVEISINADGSSTYLSGNIRTEIKLVDVIDEMHRLDIAHIDLMKINIEGAEYDLLDRLISVGIIHKICNLQIQFHNFVSDAESKRDRIRKELGKTHYLTYDYPFVWENWQKPPILKENSNDK